MTRPAPSGAPRDPRRRPPPSPASDPQPGPLRAPVTVLAADVSPGSPRAQAEVRKDDLVLPGRQTAQAEGLVPGHADVVLCSYVTTGHPTCAPRGGQ